MQAKKQKSMAELELLKAQIHPHFLFNTLNNLFAHTLKKSSASSTIVLKLSDLLRFMVYESKDKFISLNDEINLINNYIDLEQLRYGSELEISRQMEGELNGKLIIPLLLLPLIENAFKHGTSMQLDKKWINLNINVEGNKMHFILANSRDPDMQNPSVKGKRKGVGIHNVQRRLELLYPGKHTFTVSGYPNRFVVNLDLQLDTDIRVKTNKTVENFQNS
jgi:LytS/YehU family sensor histidine kinase